MSLIVVSVAAAACSCMLQRVSGGMMWDVITPVLAAVGLAAPRRRALLWALAMAVLLNASMRVHPLVLLGVWAVVIGVLGAIARGVEWERVPLGFLIVALTSLSWQVCVLLLNWFGGIEPTLDGYTLLSLVVRPLTAGVVFVLCAGTLVRAADPARFARRR